MSEDDLATAWRSARAAWPGVDLSLDDFRAHVAARAVDVAPDELALTDLYLACACARGVAGAGDALAQTFLSQVGAYIRGVDPSAEAAAEVRQRVAERLLEGGRIGEYAGRGPLGAWIRVTAVRVALDQVRAPVRERPLDDAILAGSADPELDYLRARYLPVLAEAVRAAIAALSAKQRTLLRLHHLGHVSTERLGAMHQVNQSTASRWLQAARTAVLDDVRARLEAELGVTSREMHSLAAVLLSRLDVSIERALRDD